ncbi:hypothetical protein CC2G_003413 [Coprinopsis cinerea AmutBmut pab1-1]|nr:hypothetical protein CC2G_003413 [Coprinopsis cinerea AmutBmut pab1-1]
MVSPSRCFKGGLFAASLLFSGLAAEAASIKFNRVKTPRSLMQRAPLTLHKRASHDYEDLSSFLDGLYTASVTLSSEEYKLILDTGSADMWVDKAPEHSWTDKEIPMKFQYEYANGTLSVDGTVGVAPFKFGTYSIDEQAFLNIHDDDREFFKLIGANGIMGLGLDRSHSVIDEEVKKKEGQASTWGASILNNIFDDDDWEDNYVALDLSRSEDGEDISGGNISIGDFDEQFKDVFNQPKHYVYPKGSPRWTIMMDGVGNLRRPLKRHLTALHKCLSTERQYKPRKS